MTIIALPQPEPKQTIVGFINGDVLHPIWADEPVTRLRVGNGWREVRASDRPDPSRLSDNTKTGERT